MSRENETSKSVVFAVSGKVFLSYSGRLLAGLFEYGLDDEYCALHDERQDDAVADFAPAGFGLGLLACRGGESVDGVFDRRQDFGEECGGDALLDVLGHVFDIDGVDDVVTNFHPFAAHDNTHPFSC